MKPKTRYPSTEATMMLWTVKLGSFAFADGGVIVGMRWSILCGCGLLGGRVLLSLVTNCDNGSGGRKFEDGSLQHL